MEKISKKDFGQFESISGYETDRGAYENILGKQYTEYTAADESKKKELAQDISMTIADLMRTKNLSFEKALAILEKRPSEDTFYNHHMGSDIANFFDVKFKEKPLEGQEDILIDFMERVGTIGTDNLWEKIEYPVLHAIIDTFKGNEKILTALRTICPKAAPLLEKSQV